MTTFIRVVFATMFAILIANTASAQDWVAIPFLSEPDFKSLECNSACFANGQQQWTGEFDQGQSGGNSFCQCQGGAGNSSGGEISRSCRCGGEISASDPCFSVCGGNEQAGRGTGGSKADSQLYLDVHNFYRSVHGASLLQWDAGIAAQAQAHADTCHNGHSNTSLGENVASGSGYSERELAQSWYDEEEHCYDYNTHSKKDNGQCGSVAVGHFTQIVWRSTSHLGCGVASCGFGTLVICQYSPAGNIAGFYPSNVGGK